MSSRGSDENDSIWDESGRRIRNRPATTASSRPSASPLKITQRRDGRGNSYDTNGDDFYNDDAPPRGRSRDTDNDNDDDRGWSSPSRSRNDDDTRISGGGWDNFDPWSADGNQNPSDDFLSPGASPRRQGEKQPPPQRRSGRDFQGSEVRSGRGGRGPPWSGNQQRSSDRRRGDDSFRPRQSRGSERFDKFDRKKTNALNRNGDNQRDEKVKAERSIDMNALEGAGFVHLYGISSVLNALTANRRDLQTSLERSEQGQDDVSSGTTRMDDDENYERDSRIADRSSREAVKPQAQFRPYLFMQERSLESGRRGSKASATDEILQLAKDRQIPIEYVDKGILNALSGNRPHQGLVLRCGKLHFEGLSRIPRPAEGVGTSSSSSSSSTPPVWLVLDEVVDPQNLGALLRSAYFLGQEKVGILVCAKNSAPPSPVVSAASAGALELVDIHSTVNLPRTLTQAREDGFRIIGASSSAPTTHSGRNEGVATESVDGPQVYDLQDLPTRGEADDNRPILLVLGSEGHGLRTLVAKACTEFVRIPSGMAPGHTTDSDDDGNDDTDVASRKSQAGVDSLNVSVSGGIMLWHLLNGSLRGKAD